MRAVTITGWIGHLRANAGEGSLPRLMLWLWIGSWLIHLSIVSLFIHQPIALDDMFQYDMLARSLSNGDGYRWYSAADVEILKPYLRQFLDVDSLHFPVKGLITTFRSPGYPIFLAVLYSRVPAESRFALARLVQAGLMAALAPLAAGLAYRLGFGRKAAGLAGLGASFYPILLFYPIGLASENLYIPLGLLSLVLLLEAGRRTSWMWVLLAGACCGVTILTRAIMAGFVLLACVWIGKYGRHGRKAGMVLAAAAFGICTPWMVRNSIVMHRPAFVENSLGYNLFIGYHPDGDGGFVSEVAIQPLHILDDSERDQYCLEEAIRFIRQDPLEAARRVWSRAIKYFGPEDREFFYFYSNNLVGPIPQPWLALLYLLLVIPLATTGVFGLFGLWLPPPVGAKYRGAAALAMVFLAGYGLPHLFILAEPRFHLALVPVLIPFAAHGWEMVVRLRGVGLTKKQAWGLAALLLLALTILSFGLSSNWIQLIQIMSPGGNELRFAY